MRRFVLAMLVALSTPLTMGAADPGAVTVMTMTQADRDELDAISAYLNGIVTLKGGFVQVSPNGDMSDGLFYLSKPGKLRFQYNPPVPTLVVSDGHWVAVANRRLKTIDRYQLFRMPFRVILDSKVDIRTNPQFVSLQHQQGSIVINMRTGENRSKANISLVFSEPNYELRQWTVLDDQGLATTVALRDLQPGAVLASTLFVLPDKNSLGN